MACCTGKKKLFYLLKQNTFILIKQNSLCELILLFLQNLLEQAFHVTDKASKANLLTYSIILW